MPPSFNVRPMTGALGAEVTGLDLSRLTPETFACVRELLLEHLVVVFRDQRLTPADHVALARRFGDVQVHPYHADLASPQPEILVMQGTRAVADFWHADETFQSDPPSWSILRMVECAPIGGDTLWTNQYLAYDAISPSFRSLLDGLSATHVTPDGDRCANHPVVLRHPETRRKAIYVNRQFTRRVVGLTAPESDAVLRVLFALSEQPDFQCRCRWSPGAVAIWDNRCTQHRAVADYSAFRRVERVAVVEG